MLIAIVSWWDEHPDDLRRMIGSLAGLCDRAVFLDGRYTMFPDERGYGWSPLDQYEAILSACRLNDIECALEQPVAPYAGNEVAKRARLFRLALAGATPADWLLRIDPDEHVEADPCTVLVALAATPHDVAEVTASGKSASEVDRSLGVNREWRHRCLFRALPDLTCEGLHWRYTAQGRDLWGPGQDASPALDLTQHMRVVHRERVDRERSERASVYYADRDERRAEA